VTLLSDSEYENLLRLRTNLRHFLRWSEDAAAARGLSPSEHQLLLAVRGHHDERGPTVGEVAGYLLLRHHSAVQLIDRAEERALVRRADDENDRRVVRLRLSPKGKAIVEQLASLHHEELHRLAPVLKRLWP
jgi:DNA-binding MarR family transcriptional regulator